MDTDLLFKCFDELIRGLNGKNPPKVYAYLYRWVHLDPEGFPMDGPIYLIAHDIKQAREILNKEVKAIIIGENDTFSLECWRHIEKRCKIGIVSGQIAD